MRPLKLQRYNSPDASTPNEAMLPIVAVPPNSAVCSTRFDAVASPVPAIDKASDQTRPATKSAKKYRPRYVRSERGAPVDEPAGHRLPCRSSIVENRIGQQWKRRWQVRLDIGVERAFAIAPAVVAAAASGWLVVDFLARALAHIPDDQRSGSAERRIVKAPAPRVAPSDAPDFRQIARLASEGIVDGNVVTLGVAITNRHIHPEHLAEERARILRVVITVVRSPAIANTDVEVAVGAKRDVAAVVITDWMSDERFAAWPQQDRSASRPTRAGCQPIGAAERR